MVLLSTTGRKFPIPELGGEVPIVKRASIRSVRGFVGSDPDTAKPSPRSLVESRCRVSVLHRHAALSSSTSHPTEIPTGRSIGASFSRVDAVAAPTSSIPQRLSDQVGPSHVSNQSNDDASDFNNRRQ